MKLENEENKTNEEKVEQVKVENTVIDDDKIDIAEYEGIFWGGHGSPNLRDHVAANQPFVEYHVKDTGRLYYDPGVHNRKNATVLGSELHNYAISVRLKRGDVRD